MSDKPTMTWLLLVIAVAALVTVACLSFRGRGASSESAAITSFTPNPENDKVILAKGWDEAEIRKIIHDFIETYNNNGYPAYTIEPHKQSENLYRLTFPIAGVSWGWFVAIATTFYGSYDLPRNPICLTVPASLSIAVAQSAICVAGFSKVETISH